MPETEKTVEELKSEIDRLTRVEMARLWRFAKVGHPYFQGELYEHFKNRFDSLGGMSPTISKEIGWTK